MWRRGGYVRPDPRALPMKDRANGLPCNPRHSIDPGSFHFRADTRVGPYGVEGHPCVGVPPAGKLKTLFHSPSP